MIKLDDKFLQDIGLGDLSADEKEKAMVELYEILEVRVGTSLTNSMTEEQLKQFESLLNEQKTQEEVFEWIKQEFPHYDQLVEEELAGIKAEIKATGVQNAPENKPQKSSNLFKRLGLEKLSDQEKLDISEELGGVVLDRVAARLEAILTPEQAAEFDKLLQTDEEAAFKRLAELVPDYPSIVKEEIEDMRAEIAQTHDAVIKKMTES